MKAFAFVCALVASASAAVSAAPAVENPLKLPVGVFYRPASEEMSGEIGTKAKFIRTPCPAINAMLNHGYLPRDGRNISSAQMRTALEVWYNSGDSLSDFFLSVFPKDPNEPKDLDFLSTHGIVEQDASLVHADVFFKKDPAAVDEALAKDLLSRANENGLLTKKEIVRTRKEREAALKERTGSGLGLKENFLQFCQSSALLRIFGDYDKKEISVEHARAFMVEERFPKDYQKPKEPVTFPAMLAFVTEMQLSALAPWNRE
jgi:hypothetical protein